MRKLWLGLILCALPLCAQAAPITSLPLTVGQTTHVTVTDQNGTPILPANITWSPLGSPAIVTGLADTTGFNFTGTAAGTVSAVATYTVQNGVSATLPITVTVGVTALKFTSP